ncbi:MAG: hypothetical protein M3Z37_05700 [Candidatus Eremiobacteraeota bacterium]|nr:hypothetical protein [Candidatus Eremiobacteraeota bacterium]
MKGIFRTVSLAFAVLLSGMIPLAAAAEPGYQMSITGPKTARTGQAVILSARGVNPTNGYDVYFFSAITFDPKVVSTCPGGRNEAVNLAEQTNSGSILASSLREQQDTGGRWSVVFGGKVSRVGRTLICGYTHDGLGTALATTSFWITAVAQNKKLG